MSARIFSKVEGTMKLEESDFFLCEEDGQEFYQLNIQEGFKDLILSNQIKLDKIKEITAKRMDKSRRPNK